MQSFWLSSPSGGCRQCSLLQQRYVMLTSAAKICDNLHGAIRGASPEPESPEVLLGIGHSDIASSPSRKVKSERRLVSESLQPHGLYSPWNSLLQNTEVGSLYVLQGIFPNPGIEPKSPALQADSLLAEPQRKPKNTGVGCHALLQGIFPTQGSNPHLLHCSSLLHYRWILYQLSHQRKLANVSFANIFSHSVGCLHFLIVSFSVQKFFSWIWSHLFIFAFVSIAQEIDLKKYS